MKVNVYVAVDGGAARRICWYMGTSDAQVEAAIRIQLRLQPDSKFLLRDGDGDVVPVSSTLPNGQHYTVVLQEELAVNLGGGAASEGSIIRPITSVSVNGDKLSVITREEVTSPSPSSPKRRRLETETEVGASPSLLDTNTVAAVPVPLRQRSPPPRSVSTIIAQFVDTFTRPIANDDNVSFIPNNGRFALYGLYCEVVKDEKFHPKREDVFYKMTSLHGKVDRQRVNRFYRCPVENGQGTQFVQSKPQGKGVLLRRYRKVESLGELEDVVKSAPFVSWLKLDPNEVVALYVHFVDGFVPITKSEYRAQDEGVRL